jgi:micrococcal nuclease
MARSSNIYQLRDARRKPRIAARGSLGFDRFAAKARMPFWPLTLLLVIATFYLVWQMAGPATPPNANASATRLGDFDVMDREAASFGLCHSGGGFNCVVDGDTIHYRGQKIRIADIDTPETHPPRCASEARLGNAATQRLQALLNAGPFSLRSIDRDEDPYGRKLRILSRNGQSLGGTLVNEGLARWYGSGRRSWC